MDHRIKLKFLVSEDYDGARDALRHIELAFPDISEPATLVLETNNLYYAAMELPADCAPMVINDLIKEGFFG